MSNRVEKHGEKIVQDTRNLISLPLSYSNKSRQ